MLFLIGGYLLNTRDENEGKRMDDKAVLILDEGCSGVEAGATTTTFMEGIICSISKIIQRSN